MYGQNLCITNRKGKTLKTDLVVLLCCNSYLIKACVGTATYCLSGEIVTATVAH